MNVDRDAPFLSPRFGYFGDAMRSYQYYWCQTHTVHVLLQ